MKRIGINQSINLARECRDQVRIVIVEAVTELRMTNTKIFNDTIETLDSLIEHLCKDVYTRELLNKRRDELVSANIAIDAAIDRIDPNKAPSWP